MHPAGMPERFDPLRTSFHRFWHPFRMRLSFRTIPVVSAMLRPPATLCHPFGMNRNDSNTPEKKRCQRRKGEKKRCQERMALPLVLHEFIAAVALQPSVNRECSRSWWSGIGVW